MGLVLVAEDCSVKAYAARKRFELAALRGEGSSVTGATVVVTEEEVPARRS